jgi:hypothetical protein
MPLVCLGSPAPVVATDVGVLATYRKQVQKVRLLLRERGLGAVRVGTVDDYQVTVLPCPAREGRALPCSWRGCQRLCGTAGCRPCGCRRWGCWACQQLSSTQGGRWRQACWVKTPRWRSARCSARPAGGSSATSSGRHRRPGPPGLRRPEVCAHCAARRPATGPHLCPTTCPPALRAALPLRAAGPGSAHHLHIDSFVQAGVAASSGGGSGRARGGGGGGRSRCRRAAGVLAEPQALQRGHHPRQGPDGGRGPPGRAGAGRQLARAAQVGARGRPRGPRACWPPAGAAGCGGSGGACCRRLPLLLLLDTRPAAGSRLPASSQPASARLWRRYCAARGAYRGAGREHLQRLLHLELGAGDGLLESPQLDGEEEQRVGRRGAAGRRSAVPARCCAPGCARVASGPSAAHVLPSRCRTGGGGGGRQWRTRQRRRGGRRTRWGRR